MLTIKKPAEWEAEAVDFIPVELERLSKTDLLKYAEEARNFILATMNTMELRPKRSLVKKTRTKQ